MRKFHFIILLFISLITISCQFSKGVKKDLNTGLTASYNGFSIDDIFLTDGDRNRLDNNKISLGTTLLVMATGVKNFVEKNGRVFPGCTIVLTDKDKKQLLHLPDAFFNKCLRSVNIFQQQVKQFRTLYQTGIDRFPFIGCY